jgi:transcriptional regulator of acetoin/glycerol metabolism
MTFLVALGDDAALTADHISGIERLARRVVEFVHRTPSLQEERNLSRRLEAVAKILPTLFRVLDVREIFDRISTIATEVLRHDFATIGLFVDDLTTLQVYVQTLSLRSASAGSTRRPRRDRRRVRLARQRKLQAAGCRHRAANRRSDRVECLARARAGGRQTSRRGDGARGEARITRPRSHRRARRPHRRPPHRWRIGALAAGADAGDASGRDRNDSVAAGRVRIRQGSPGRFLHRASPRSNGPFIALNCAALPEQLLEAELFGYERGAYTGATQSKPGQLELAAGGTLFLDEVGEMSPSAQAKFLRVLQEREFQRLGGTRVLRSDARIVAATNRDLPRAIGNGQFREDLYYRLNVFAIQLPSLRDRRDDILPLAEAFLAEIGRGLGRPPAGVSREARKALTEYDWPGNVRELRNILERAAILCDGGLITTEHLAIDPSYQARVRAGVAGSVSATAPSTVKSVGELQSLERGMVEQALQKARFNKSKAEKALGLTRQQLYVRMRRYGLE